MGFARHAVAQTFARHKLHHEIQQAIAFARRVDGHDVRMAQLGDRARFLNKSLAQFRARGQFGRDHFDRHLAVERDIAREKDGAHAALSKGPHNHVLSCQCYGQAGLQIRRVVFSHLSEDGVWGAVWKLIQGRRSC